MFCCITASAAKDKKGGKKSEKSAETVYQPKPSVYDALPAAKKGGTLFLPLLGNPKVINPVLEDDSNSRTLVEWLWAPLIYDDFDTLDPLPGLAETFTVSADHKAYKFVLNKDAKWSDGTPVTTDDVKFTFDTLMDEKTDAAALRSYWRGASLEVQDARTFTFRIEEPRFDTLRFFYGFVPIQKSQFAGEPNFNKAKGVLNPIGNGPYVFKSFSRDQKIELERNKNWWGSSIPHLKNRYNADKVVFRIVPDINLQYEKLLKGELDAMDFLGSGLEIFVKKAREADKAKVGEKPGTGTPVWAGEFKNKAPRGYGYVGWNLRRPLFASKKTRQALAHLADVNDIANKVYYGYNFQSTSPFGSLSKNSDPELRKPGKMITLDVKKALQLLKEDGWADTDKDNVLDKMIDGKKTPFKFVVKYNSNNTARAKVAQILQQNFKKAGIQFEIRAMEWNAFLDDVDNREFDAVILAWTGVPFPNPRQEWHTDSAKNKGSNLVGFSNKHVDELIDKATYEFDEGKRVKILHEINRILYDEQPYLWLTEPRSLVAGFSTKVKSNIWAYSYSVYPPFDIYTYE